MKLCMSHYIHKSIPDATFEADSFSSFGDMTSQNFPRKKGTSDQTRLFTPGIGYNRTEQNRGNRTKEEFEGSIPVGFCFNVC